MPLTTAGQDLEPTRAEHRISASAPGANDDAVQLDAVSHKSGRGPSPEKTDQTRRQIVTAALAEFLEVGIAAATMAQIARRAKVAKGSLYNYFPSKEALLHGVVEQALAHITTEQQTPERLPGESMHDWIARSLLTSMKALERTGRADLARLVLSQARYSPELAALYYAKGFAPWQAHARKLLQAAIDEGELRGMTAEQGAQLLAAPFWMAIVQGELVGRKTGKRLDIASLMRMQLGLLFQKIP